MNLTTGYPFSLIKNGLPANYPKLESSIYTDVAIIGGGISGALMAYHLIEAGVKCVVVDGRTIGLGSTCASTSLLQYELDTPLSQLSQQIGWEKASRSYKLCVGSIDSIQKISKKLDFPFEKSKSLLFAEFKKDTAFIEKEYAARKKAGFEVELLYENDIKKEFGFTSPAAILSAQAASTDAYLLTHALLRHCIKKGLQVYDRTYVSKIVYNKKGAGLKIATGHSISAKKIINATGYEVTEFIDKKIVQLHSTYAIASENMKERVLPENLLLWNTADPYLYMRETADKRIIIGGRDEEFYSPAKRDKLIRKKTALLKKDFKKMFPEVYFQPEFSWTGTFGSTNDSLPYIGTYTKTPHTYYALGFGGNGITFSVIGAEIVRDLILGKKSRDAELFSFDR